MENKVYAISNPYFLSDIFVFKEHPAFGSVYIKLNCNGKIEEIGRNFDTRFHRQVQDIIRLADCHDANDKQKKALDLIGDEYFYTI